MISISSRSPLVQKWGAQQVAAAALRRRPQNPEAHLPGIDTTPATLGQKGGEMLADAYTPPIRGHVSASTAPPVTSPPLVVPARGTSQVLMYPNQAAKRLAETQTGLTLGDLAVLSMDPSYHVVTSGMRSLLQINPTQGVVTPCAPPGHTVGGGTVASVSTPMSAGFKAPLGGPPFRGAGHVGAQEQQHEGGAFASD
jgi:hypothetical protein